VPTIFNELERRNPGIVTDIAKPLFYPGTKKLITDLDLETIQAIVQINSGKGTDLVGSVQQLVAALKVHPELAEQANKVIIAYGPGLTKALRYELAKTTGALATNKVSTLLDVLKP
jgi:hypothetical protein